jgi:hypothetical protein
MLYAEIKTMFYLMLGDDESSPRFVTSDMALGFANEAIARAAMVSRGLEARTFLLLTADVGEYALPSDCDLVRAVYYDGERIVPVAQFQLMAQDEAFDQLSGTPEAYYMDELNRKIGLYKKPSSGTTYFAISPEDGAVTGVVVGGVAATFNQEDGVVVDISDASDTYEFTQEDGEIVSGVDALALDVHYTVMPDPIVTADEEVELPAWSMAYLVAAMLSSALGAETVIQDEQAAGFWSSLADHVLARMLRRSNDRGRTEFERPALWRSGYPIQYPAHLEDA